MLPSAMRQLGGSEVGGCGSLIVGFSDEVISADLNERVKTISPLLFVGIWGKMP